ncbi:MAG: glutamate--tRNA ligase [Acidimicrobiales bacterium]|nr:glutamate--tRNA ligase [Acidimicrobiales bacterium]
MADAPRLRFAPSPTGYLHVGGARAALFNWLVARRTGGEFLLRIEDTDRERNRPELTDNILEAMRWLGLDWDGDVVYQADHLDEHAAGARSLLAAGDAYWCDCTPEDLEARRGKGASGYDGHCRDRAVAEGPTTALRFRAPDDGTTEFDDVIRGSVSFDNATIEDFVLLRSSGLPVFLLSNAMDDAAMGITHVVRGEDHVNGTPKYLLLRDALGLARPDVIAHLPLLVNESRKKLSKRRDSVAVGEFRERGFLPEAMMNHLALLGWGPKDDVEIRPMREIIERFRLGDVNPAPAFFDEKKLEHINAEYVRALSPEAFVDAVEPFLVRPERSLEPIRQLAPVLQQRVRVLPDAEPMVDFLHLDEPVRDQASWDKVMGKDPAVARAMLKSTIDAFAEVEWDADALHACLLRVGEEHGLKLGKAQAPVRVAVTGRSVGPPLFESLEVLGRTATLERLHAALDDLGPAGA